MTNDLFRDLLDGKISVPSRAVGRVDPRPPTMAELQQGLLIHGIIVESWQLEVLDRAFQCHSLGRFKRQPRMVTVNWQATHQPGPFGVNEDTSNRMRLGIWDPEPVPPTGPRQQALAAKAARGHGPPQPASWRGKERTTKYRSQK